MPPVRQVVRVDFKTWTVRGLGWRVYTVFVLVKPDDPEAATHDQSYMLEIAAVKQVRARYGTDQVEIQAVNRVYVPMELPRFNALDLPGQENKVTCPLPRQVVVNDFPDIEE